MHSRGFAAGLWPAARLALAAAVLLAAVPVTALAQRPPLLRHLGDVKKLPGRLVAQAAAPQPETALGLTGYRVEHVTLPEARRVPIEGRSTEVGEGWHITVFFATPLTVRDQAFSLAIDGRWCGFLAEAADLLSADTVCFDAKLIRDGAALGVTYRGIQMVSAPDAERLLGPEALFADGDEAIHYSSTRLQLVGTR